MEAGRIAWELNLLSVTNLFNFLMPVIKSILLGVWQRRSEREREREREGEIRKRLRENSGGQMGSGKQKRGVNTADLTYARQKVLASLRDGLQFLCASTAPLCTRGGRDCRV